MSDADRGIAVGEHPSVHGVRPAPEAVLAGPDVHRADLVVPTGDLAAGPRPVPTLDLLVSPGERARWVEGNCGRELVALAPGRRTVGPPHQRPGGCDPSRSTCSTGCPPPARFPGIAEWTDFLVRNPSSEREALATFEEQARAAAKRW